MDKTIINLIFICLAMFGYINIIDDIQMNEMDQRIGNLENKIVNVVEVSE